MNTASHACRARRARARRPRHAALAPAHIRTIITSSVIIFAVMSASAALSLMTPFSHTRLSCVNHLGRVSAGQIAEEAPQGLYCSPPG